MRADKFTQIQKIQDMFSDFLDDMSPHPITGDIAKIRNEQSIKQSLRNLILTNYGERLFQPNIGCNILNSLFEINDQVAADDLKYHITQTIINSEPRASLIDVQVFSDYNQNSVSVNIIFSIINTSIPQSVEIILRRVR
jgi:phage baseplate assembly protein W